MSFSWPLALVALLAFPLLLLYRWWVRRRRRPEAVRVSNIAVIRAALPGRSLWRRRIPLWLFAAGLLVLGTGAARPQASVPVPSSSASILLAIDVSASMCATDVKPNRFTVATQAAREFIEAQKEGTNIALVAFGGVAGLVVEHTTDKKKLLDAIDRLRTARGTAIGQAILVGIDAIAEFNTSVPPTGVELPGVPSGTDDYVPDTIVVLTDGRNTQGVVPITAAEEAAARHIRVYTIGFGTTNPAPLVCTRDQIGNDAATRGDRGGFGGGRVGGGGGGGRNLQIDEPTLKQVATMTGGEYFRAEDSEALTDVLLHLPNSIVVQFEDVEITVWFAIAGAILVLVAVGLAQWWNRFTGIPPPGRQGASGG